MRKNTFGFILFVLGISILIGANFTITGGVIGSDFHLSLYSILGLLFVVGSFILFLSKQSLDAIIVPTGEQAGEKRAIRAAKESDKLKDKGYFLISGIIHRDSSGKKRNYQNSQTKELYDNLREQGVDPRKIKIEPNSRSTIENVLESLEHIKKLGGKEVGIASYPRHLDRFEYIIKKAKEEGVVDNNFHLHRLETKNRKDETYSEKTHEIISKLLQRYKLRHGLKEAGHAEDDLIVKYSKKIKGFIENLF